jgi:hypothetical protein
LAASNFVARFFQYASVLDVYPPPTKVIVFFPPAGAGAPPLEGGAAGAADEVVPVGEPAPLALALGAGEFEMSASHFAWSSAVDPLEEPPPQAMRRSEVLTPTASVALSFLTVLFIDTPTPKDMDGTQTAATVSPAGVVTRDGRPSISQVWTPS